MIENVLVKLLMGWFFCLAFTQSTSGPTPGIYKWHGNL